MQVTPIDYLKLQPWTRAVHGNRVSIVTGDGVDAIAPRLGPSATLLLYRCARRFADDDSFEWITYSALGRELGIGVRQLVNTIERLIGFGYARWGDPGCELLQVVTDFSAPATASVVTLPTASGTTLDVA